MKAWNNGQLRELSAEEIEVINTERKAWEDKSADRKLARIKQIRDQKLKATDWMANSDVTMPDNIKTWRQSLRDIPSNHTDEDAYDLLLAKDSDGNLTHSIWTQPTE